MTEHFGRGRGGGRGAEGMERQGVVSGDGGGGGGGGEDEGGEGGGG